MSFVIGVGHLAAEAMTKSHQTNPDGSTLFLDGQTPANRVVQKEVPSLQLQSELHHKHEALPRWNQRTYPIH
jgi:hypothetical protein